MAERRTDFPCEFNLLPSGLSLISTQGKGWGTPILSTWGTPKVNVGTWFCEVGQILYGWHFFKSGRRSLFRYYNTTFWGPPSPTQLGPLLKRDRRQSGMTIFTCRRDGEGQWELALGSVTEEEEEEEKGAGSMFLFH